MDSDPYLELYAKLEPVSEEEAAMLFPGAIGNVDGYPWHPSLPGSVRPGKGWPWYPTSARLFGVSEQNVLHMFAQSHYKGEWSEMAQHLSSFDWFHYVWQDEQRWAGDWVAW